MWSSIWHHSVGLSPSLVDGDEFFHQSRYSSCSLHVEPSIIYRDRCEGITKTLGTRSINHMNCLHHAPPVETRAKIGQDTTKHCQAYPRIWRDIEADLHLNSRKLLRNISTNHFVSQSHVVPSKQRYLQYWRYCLVLRCLGGVESWHNLAQFCTFTSSFSLR